MARKKHEEPRPAPSDTAAARELGRDPVTGVAGESIRWALRTVNSARPGILDEDGEAFAHWLNTMAALADAFMRAGGTHAELRTFEGDGFFFGNLPPERDQGVTTR